MRNLKAFNKHGRIILRSKSRMITLAQEPSIFPRVMARSVNETNVSMNTIYSSYSITDLLKGHLVLTMSSITPVVNHAQEIINFSRFVLGDKITTLILKKTIYSHFCGGETEDEVHEKASALFGRGLVPILDFSVEANESSNSFIDQGLDFNLQQLETVNNIVPEGLSSIKPSSLCKPSMLGALTKFLNEEDVSLGQIELTFAENSMDGFVKGVVNINAPEELKEDMAEMARNLYKIGSRAVDLKQSILVDAEYFAFQPAIDYFVLKAMQFFNKENPVFLNTFQCYLKRSNGVIDDFLENSKEHNFHVGVKLVRGAYMVHESSFNEVSPIHDTIQLTHSCYNKNIEKLLYHLEKHRKGGVVFATHNMESVQRVLRNLKYLSRDTKKRVAIAQLAGMAENVTHFASQNEVVTLKLLPYGPVFEVLPYLIRRAQENNTVLSETKIQRKEIFREIVRRIAPRFLF